VGDPVLWDRWTGRIIILPAASVPQATSSVDSLSTFYGHHSYSQPRVINYGFLLPPPFSSQTSKVRPL